MMFLVFLRVLYFNQVSFLPGIIRPRRRRFAGAERGSRLSQFALNAHCGRVRAAEHAARDLCRILEHRHGLAEIVERGAGVQDALKIATERADLEERLQRARDPLEIAQLLRKLKACGQDVSGVPPPTIANVAGEIAQCSRRSRRPSDRRERHCAC